MMFFQRKRDPEDPKQLAKLRPSKRYTREEVEQLLALLGGLVNDGLPLVEIGSIVETPLWYAVEMTYRDETGNTAEMVFETWYFFKA